MLEVFRQSPRALMYAVAVHLLLLILLIISLDWTPKLRIRSAGEEVVQAVVVDKLPQQSKPAPPKAEPKPVEPKPVEPKPAEPQRDLKAEQEAQRKAAAEQQQKEAAIRIAEQKRKTEEAAKRKAAEEQKLKAAEAAKRKAAEVQKRKAEVEAKRKAAEDAKRREAEQELQRQLAAEQAAREGEAARSLMEQYVGLIGGKVERNWVRPPGAGQGKSCTVEVKLIPGGDVVAARIVKSSGDPAFDRSVETAVYRAAPLPVPEDPKMFEYFRELRFEFAPDQ